LTRLDIAYVVNKLCKYMSNPTTTHWQSYKRVLRYFKEIVNQGLFFFSFINNIVVSIFLYGLGRYTWW
jgi:hypothetical protein